MIKEIFNQAVADDYDAHLRRPVIRTIRKQEKQALLSFFDEHLGKDDSVMEIGAGTGYYTFEIARRVSRLLAQEPSMAMFEILKRRINAAANIKIINTQIFEHNKPDQKYDHVIAIGVLDYIKDAPEFLKHCLSLANKTLIFSAPQQGLLGKIYKFLGQLTKTDIFIYSKNDILKIFPKQKIKFKETGLKSKFNAAMTLITVVEKQ